MVPRRFTTGSATPVRKAWKLMDGVGRYYDPRGVGALSPLEPSKADRSPRRIELNGPESYGLTLRARRKFPCIASSSTKSTRCPSASGPSLYLNHKSPSR